MNNFKLEGCKYWLSCEQCGFTECKDAAYLPSLIRELRDEIVGYLYDKGATLYLIGVVMRWSRWSIGRSLKRYFERRRDENQGAERD